MDKCTDDMDTKIGVIMRQTTYDTDLARSKYTEHSGDVTSIIREFVGGKRHESTIPTTTNQKLYKALRDHISIV